MSEEQYVLGFDGGGTKSIAVIAREDGEVISVGLSGRTNFQSVGVVHAGVEVKAAIEIALEGAGISPDSVATAAYGIAGADREADFDTVYGYVQTHNPAGWMLLVNDTTIALRAGTADGTGVALICGTGANCIGFNEEGKQAKVGGLGRFTGDAGGGEDIVERAIVACMEALDGRGPKTMLTGRLCEALGIDELEDILAFYYAESYNPPDLGGLVPIVFDCAGKGDRVANSLLEKIGRSLARNALTASKRLFGRDEKFRVVLGGSILQKSRPAIFAEIIKERFARRFSNAEVMRLRDEPVLGAVFFALDMMHGKAGRRRMALARKSYRAKAAR